MKQRMMRSLGFVGLLILLGMAVACGGDAAPAETPAPSEPAVEPVEATPATGYPLPGNGDEPVVGYPEPPQADQGIAPGEPYPGAGGPVEPGTLFVDEVDLALMESFPLQLMATVRGNFADGCTYYDTHLQEIEGNTIQIELQALRPADQMCTEALVPFEQNISVDILGLPAGEYTVVVNDSASASFTLDVDNE